jgi:hypothetical protein
LDLGVLRYRTDITQGPRGSETEERSF